MRRILIVNTVPFKRNGISNVIFQYTNALAGEKFRFDYVGLNEMQPQWKAEIVAQGGNIFVLPRKSNPPLYCLKLYRLLKRGGYDGIHVHGNSCTMALELVPARLAGVPMRFAHGHSISCNHPLINGILRPFFEWGYTAGLACSDDAGSFLFGNRPFTVCANAFDTETYAYSDASRTELRKAHGLEGKLVWGNAATLSASKNHLFLIRAFREFQSICPDSALVIAGKGPMEQALRTEAEGLNVVFLGECENVGAWMSAFDCFVFPSKFEGLGIALLEAQVNGLPVFASSGVIPKQAGVNENYHSLALTTPEEWGREIAGVCLQRVSCGKTNVKKAGFEISEQADKLAALYSVSAVQGR